MYINIYIYMYICLTKYMDGPHGPEPGPEGAWPAGAGVSFHWLHGIKRIHTNDFQAIV